MELEMACSCGLEGVREIEARRLRILRRMHLRDMRDLTTAIVMSLAFDFGADAEVCADQWFGIGLGTPLIEGGLFVQCDWPHDGLATLWEYLADKFPDRVSVDPKGSPTHERVAERVSAWLMEQYDRADAVYLGHRKTAHVDDNDCSPCEDCDVFRAIQSAAHVALDHGCGSEVLDREIERAFNERWGG